ncbi:MAG: HAMP domain-containing histidine kinase, partial [Bacteroidales bacterium]|nr:HAMP domain-containing histidine kinase [Bacteroidales bacterium]
TTDHKIDFKVNIYVPEPDFVAAIINDITEETKIHRENKERSKQLQRLNIMLDDRNNELQKAIETKNKFISLIAHDLRNPLNAINGLSELLTKRLKPETDQRALDMAKVLHQSAKGASELLDNLLIWARTQQNTIQFNPETLNVHAITADTINEIKVQAERKHIMLINSTTTDDTVWADKLMLQTIIRNIVSNAIKFTNEGGLIVIGSSQTTDNTEITIEDNGVGMTQETIQKIVGSTELNSTKGTSGETGTGMGLIISKEFIQRHKGTLNIESTVGKGSTFIITLPGDKK